MSKRNTWVLRIERELGPLVERLPDGSVRWKRRPNLSKVARDLGCSAATVHNIVAQLFDRPDMPPSRTTLARIKRAKRVLARRAEQAREVEQTPAAISLRLAAVTKRLTAVEDTLAKVLDGVEALMSYHGVFPSLGEIIKCPPDPIRLPGTDNGHDKSPREG